jgi:hypothetical protein
MPRLYGIGKLGFQDKRFSKSVLKLRTDDVEAFDMVEVVIRSEDPGRLFQGAGGEHDVGEWQDFSLAIKLSREFPNVIPAVGVSVCETHHANVFFESGSCSQ